MRSSCPIPVHGVCWYQNGTIRLIEPSGKSSRVRVRTAREGAWEGEEEGTVGVGLRCNHLLATPSYTTDIIGPICPTRTPITRSDEVRYTLEIISQTRYLPIILSPLTASPVILDNAAKDPRGTKKDRPNLEAL